MILVDTSVWIRFIANRNPYASTLEQLLETEDVVGHEFIYGELLVGDCGGRSELLKSYSLIPHLNNLSHGEVVEFVRARRLMGLGIGWIDLHLLACCVAYGAQLYTAEHRLLEVASRLHAAYY